MVIFSLTDTGTATYSSPLSSSHIIPLYAFANNEKLLKIKLREGLKEIGSSAFAHCTELTHFEIPASVERIGEGAFSDCHNVNTLLLPLHSTNNFQPF